MYTIRDISFETRLDIPEGMMIIAPEGLMEKISMASHILNDENFEKYLKATLEVNKNKISITKNIGK